MNKTILLFLLLSGCSHKLTVPKMVSIDTSLQVVVDDFVDEARRQNVIIVIDNLLVHFSSGLGARVLGECTMYDRGEEGNPTIYINKQQWETNTVLENKVVLFHELGHCVLWREHDEKWLGFMVKSIMYPYLEEESMYYNHWNYYMWELFHGI